MKLFVLLLLLPLAVVGHGFFLGVAIVVCTIVASSARDVVCACFFSANAVVLCIMVLSWSFLLLVACWFLPLLLLIEMLLVSLPHC